MALCRMPDSLILIRSSNDLKGHDIVSPSRQNEMSFLGTPRAHESTVYQYYGILLPIVPMCKNLLHACEMRFLHIAILLRFTATVYCYGLLLRYKPIIEAYHVQVYGVYEWYIGNTRTSTIV